MFTCSFNLAFACSQGPSSGRKFTVACSSQCYRSIVRRSTIGLCVLAAQDERLEARGTGKECSVGCDKQWKWVYWQALEYVQLAQPVVLHRLENCHGEK
jgi:hypothetical protein